MARRRCRQADAAAIKPPAGKALVGRRARSDPAAQPAAARGWSSRRKERGSVTFDQLNAALPQEIPARADRGADPACSSDRASASARDEDGGNGEPAEAEAELRGRARRRGAEGEEAALDEEDLGRTDDPVRMYLREMGTIELLSREGEIEIAKRIEAGRNTVLEALCESPLTMRAMIGWRDAIREGRVLLRDIIDLEATNYGGRAAGATARRRRGDRRGDGDRGRGERRRVVPTARRAGRGRRRGRDDDAERGETACRRRRGGGREPSAPSRSRRTISTRTRCRCRRWRASCATACSRPSTDRRGLSRPARAAGGAARR